MLVVARVRDDAGLHAIVEADEDWSADSESEWIWLCEAGPVTLLHTHMHTHMHAHTDILPLFYGSYALV